MLAAGESPGGRQEYEAASHLQAAELMTDTEHREDTPREDPPLPTVIRFVDRLSDSFAYLAAAAVVLLAVSIFIDVIGRKFFNAPFTGTLERTANWWMPMLTLLAFPFTEKRQEHIKVTVLLDALPLRMRQIVEAWFGLLATGLLVALAWYTLQDALKSASFGQTTASTPPVAIWPFKFVAVAGMAILALQSAATAYRHFAGLLPATHTPDSEADLG